MLVAQLSDLHLMADPEASVYGVQPDRTFARVLRRLHEEETRPELLLLTGDLSEDGSTAAYARLREALAETGLPACWIPGNHDDAQAARSALDRSPVRAPSQGDVPGWTLVLLDSQVDGAEHGALSEGSLAALERTLATHAEQPALVASHHPPLQIGAPYIDRINLREAGPLLEILANHAPGGVYLYGHVHQEARHERGPWTFLGCPATCVQFPPGVEVFAPTTEPPGYRLVHLEPDGAWDTRVRRA